ncbi:MAG: spore maturation protein [Alphaproteobacteria bacterium]|nr:spore maturation protein [Alphaproteobacteria bacterium]
MLNIIWSGFFLSAFVVALWQTIVNGNVQIWSDLANTLFDSSKNAFEITLSLTGMMCLWLGLLKIAEKSGLTEVLAKILRPLFRKLLPEIPADSPAQGSIVMNMAANILGLDNAATPIGIKAMEQLQDLNPHKEKASSAQILFMVINTSSVTLIPISILMFRQQFGATEPSMVFLPILLATSVSTLVGFISVAIAEKLPIYNRTVLGYLSVFLIFIVGISCLFASLDAENRILYASLLANIALFGMIILFIASGLICRLNVYNVFIEGAKEGFETAVRIIPYMVAMLVGIAVFRTSGALDYLLSGCEYIISLCHINNDFIPALPTALMKPLSGSGARAMMIETIQNYGVDSFPALVSSVIQGSTETTFYVLAVYFGAVKITKTGSAVPCALLADLAGICAAIGIAYIFWH